ncbi:MAG: hypothetical protein ACP5KA_07060 [Desulfurococcaceae archaeon]
MSRNLRKKLLSYAGEYLVAAKLSLMGYLVTLTPKGAPEVDVLVYDVENRRAKALQVKALRQKAVPLGVQVTKKDIEDKLREKIRNPFIIVYLPRDDLSKAEFYIVPPGDLREIAKKEYFDWLAKPLHKKPREVLEETPQPLAVSLSKLKPYREKWENIWTE